MNAERLQMPTWYGLKATIELSPNRMLHRAGIGRWLIPHPPVFNWMLRAQLDETAYRRLSVLHELGHFQVLPAIILYLLSGTAVLTILRTTTVQAVIWLLGIFPLWELLAEMYVRWKERSSYRQIFRAASSWRKTLFWGGNAAAVLIQLGCAADTG
jgi:hypothetical protein